MADEISRTIRALDNQALKQLWLDSMKSWADERNSPYSALGKDVLARISFFTVAGEMPDPADRAKSKAWEEQLDKVVESVSPYGKPYLRARKQYYVEHQAHYAEDLKLARKEAPVRNSWTPEKIAAFEAGL